MSIFNKIKARFGGDVELAERTYRNAGQDALAELARKGVNPKAAQVPTLPAQASPSSSASGELNAIGSAAADKSGWGVAFSKSGGSDQKMSPYQSGASQRNTGRSRFPDGSYLPERLKSLSANFEQVETEADGLATRFEEARKAVSEAERRLDRSRDEFYRSGVKENGALAKIEAEIVHLKAKRNSIAAERKNVLARLAPARDLHQRALAFAKANGIEVEG
ncbi:hypothetical protein [Thalassospira sp. CH_XMU1458]|uniref:hypothetical protein n=1 Tax=Thalassospira sp. CH_XMU1458 TaxID=3107776 RepID=UPI00300CB8E3